MRSHRRRIERHELAQTLEQDPQLDPLTVSITGSNNFYVAAAVISAPVFGLLVLPIRYHCRAVRYIIIDDDKIGGLKALMQNRLMMHRRSWKLVRLDLSFWWFYTLEIAFTALSIGSLCAPTLGLSFPFSDGAAYWIFQLAASLGYVALHALAAPKVKVAYALCFQQFLHQPEPSTPARQGNTRGLIK